MRRLVVLVLAGLAGSAAAEERLGARRLLGPHEIKAAVANAAGGGSGARLCRFSAYSRDPTRTNLRAGPSTEASVVATLPGQRLEDAAGAIGPEFQVIGGKGNWLLIRGAHWAGYGRDETALVLGPAWMAANLVSFTIGGTYLRREPREAAPSILSFVAPSGVSPSWGPDSVKVDRVFGCSGSFVDVAVTLPDGRKARGWVSGLCSNQVTTCDGSGHPYEEREGGLYRSEEACRQGGDDSLCPPHGR